LAIWFVKDPSNAMMLDKLVVVDGDDKDRQRGCRGHVEGKLGEKRPSIRFCCSRSAVFNPAARNSSMRGLLAQPLIGSLPSARIARLA
jgi:hypothetical protein